MAPVLGRYKRIESFVDGASGALSTVEQSDILELVRDEASGAVEMISATVEQFPLFEMQCEEVITTRSGLRYVDRVIGEGEVPKRGDVVRVHYVGTLEDGTQFDSSLDRGQPIEFELGKGKVIKGW